MILAKKKFEHLQEGQQEHDDDVLLLTVTEFECFVKCSTCVLFVNIVLSFGEIIEFPCYRPWECNFLTKRLQLFTSHLVRRSINVYIHASPSITHVCKYGSFKAIEWTAGLIDSYSYRNMSIFGDMKDLTERECMI